MKRLLLEIDFHIVILGLVVSVLFVGIVSMITFVPGTFSILRVILYASIPAFVFLGPTIITGTIDRRKHRADAVRYFAMNTLVALTYGFVSGVLIYGLLPQKDVLDSTRAEQDAAEQPATAAESK
ncbi:MAG: hypothetical protein MI807_03925 [Verrucomicrobiales bacterium]|nr:hypothetical protein [Verrucomicrobiales bacterium]